MKLWETNEIVGGYLGLELLGRLSQNQIRHSALARVDASSIFHDIPTIIASLPNLARVGGSVHMFTSTCDIELRRNCEKAVTNWSISIQQLITAMKGTTGLVVATLWIAVREPVPEPKVMRELCQSLMEADWDSTSSLIRSCLHGGKVASYHWVVIAGLKTFMWGWKPPVEMDEGSSAVADILDEGEPDEAQCMLLDMFDMKEISEPVVGAQSTESAAFSQRG
eukprot:scaffold421247_cov37-Attheya_sp.AAC.4